MDDGDDDDDKMTKMGMMMNNGKKSMTKEKMGPIELHVSAFILAEKVLMAGIVLKGGYCNYSNYLMLGIIYGLKIGETSRSDLKVVQKTKS